MRAKEGAQLVPNDGPGGSSLFDSIAVPQARTTCLLLPAQQRCAPHRDEAVLLPAVAQHGVRVVALDERELQAQAQHTI